MRPVIGITSYVERARWGVWDAAVTLLPQRYVDRVAAVGAVPLVVPPVAALDDDLAGRLDGLVLAGGADLSPDLYGAAPHPLTTGVRPDRDAGELTLLRAALRLDLPVLGICRGMQLMTVAHGGALHQHLPDVVDHDGHRAEAARYVRHGVRLEPGSLVHDLLGDELDVPSYHHQGIASTGSLRASGWAGDGTVEAVEVPGARFALGVLWHPEVDDDPRLFGALAAAAAGSPAVRR